MNPLPTDKNSTYKTSIGAVAASANASKMTKITPYLLVLFILTIVGVATILVPKMIANNNKSEELKQFQQQLEENSKRLQGASTVNR
ncbi:MAG: hypothetical protein ACM3JF_02465 [Sphaerimonospora mesophila]